MAFWAYETLAPYLFLSQKSRFLLVIVVNIFSIEGCFETRARHAEGERRHGGDDEKAAISSGTSEGLEKYISYFDGLKTGTLEVAHIASTYLNRAYPLISSAAN
ncbi:hypothetical protein GOP47_0007016 [Adiantum capillus-veneris]|uniref:Uncharacterized protein n=1 Tax=Adiantum capillus-veneris TaxID=13818 RepID=A0A9D4V0Q3_ADICA|nr:hypothetical protein GOP47_0007016 [Adiantum capillus-veneris]